MAMKVEGLWKPSSLAQTPDDAVQWRTTKLANGKEYTVPVYFTEEQTRAAAAFLRDKCDLRQNLIEFADRTRELVRPLLGDRAEAFASDMLFLLVSGRLGLGDLHRIKEPSAARVCAQCVFDPGSTVVWSGIVMDGEIAGREIDFVSDGEAMGRLPGGDLLLVDAPAIAGFDGRMPGDGFLSATLSGYVGRIPSQARSATFNLRRFLRGDGQIDFAWLARAAEIAVIALEVHNPPGGLSLCLGVCGLAELLMATGRAYASEDGRALAGLLLALLQASASHASADLARMVGAFPGYLDVVSGQRQLLIELGERIKAGADRNQDPGLGAVLALAGVLCGQALSIAERSGLRHPLVVSAGYPGPDAVLLGGTPGVSPMASLAPAELAVAGRALGLDMQQISDLIAWAKTDREKPVPHIDPLLVMCGDSIMIGDRLAMAGCAQEMTFGLSMADLGKRDRAQVPDILMAAREAGVSFVRMTIPPIANSSADLSPLFPDPRDSDLPAPVQHRIVSSYSVRWADSSIAVSVERRLRGGSVEAEIGMSGGIDRDVIDRALALARLSLAGGREIAILPDDFLGDPIAVDGGEKIGAAATPFQAALVIAIWASSPSRIAEIKNTILSGFSS